MKKSKDESGKTSRFHFYTTPFGQIILLVLLGFMGIQVRNLIFLTQSKDLPSYYLRIRDRDLVFSESPNRAGEAWRESVLLTRPMLGYKYEVSEDKGKSHMIISVGDKKSTRDGHVITDMTFAPKTKCVYFADVNLGKSDRSELWRWNEQVGFTKLTEMSGALMDLRLSPNEDALCSSTYDPKREPRTKSVMLTLLDNRSSEIDIDRGDTICAALDKDTIIATEYHFQFIQKRERDLYKINIGSGAHSVFLPGQNVFEAIAFNGSIWCLCVVQGKYSAIRLNVTNDKVEERIDLSKYVDRPWPKVAAKMPGD